MLQPMPTRGRSGGTESYHQRRPITYTEGAVGEEVLNPDNTGNGAMASTNKGNEAPLSVEQRVQLLEKVRLATMNLLG